MCELGESMRFCIYNSANVPSLFNFPWANLKTPRTLQNTLGTPQLTPCLQRHCRLSPSRHRLGPHPPCTALSLSPHAPLSAPPCSPHAPLSSAHAQSPVVLVTFDGSATDRKWHVTNDPVMGGQSKSTFAVKDGVGMFSGTCAVVPFLKAPGLCKPNHNHNPNPHPSPNPSPNPNPNPNPKPNQAPGFCNIGTEHGLFMPPKFADASAFIDGSLYLTLKSSTPSYKGFKVDFGAKNLTRPSGNAMHHSSASLKANFEVPAAAAAGFVTIKVPFSSLALALALSLALALALALALTLALTLTRSRSAPSPSTGATTRASATPR